MSIALLFRLVLNTVLFVLSLTAFGMLLVSSRFSVDHETEFRAQMAAVSVKAPPGVPSLSQESIDLAMALYGIDLPPNASWPKFDKALEDRGLTTRGAFMPRAEVTIGPAAFQSWSLLASTLGHELEVHCQQNFLFIYLLDAIGLDGTGEAERQAYKYEISNARRFGLSNLDADLIANTMNYYYPDFKEHNRNWSFNLRNWLAKNLMSPQAQL